MTNMGKKVLAGAALLWCLIGFSACEDPVPEDNYKPEYLVEAMLYVGDPIEGLRLSLTQPVLDTFRYEQSLVRDADVVVLEGDTPLQLEWRDAANGLGDYYLPDADYRVKPNTLYHLEVRTTDGKLITGSTRTPQAMEWVKRTDNVLQYPLDTINLESPDSLDIKWTSVEDAPAYLISVRCEDTVAYGFYLDPPVEEPNRRIYRFWEEDAPNYNEVVRWGFAGINSSPVVWFAFKWYGLQALTIYAPNQEYYEWFRLTHRGQSEYDFRLASVEGDGTGVFAAASVIRDTIFVLKNTSP